MRQELAELAASAHYLLVRAQIAGNMTCDGHVASDAELEIAAKCRELNEKLKAALAECNISEIGPLLDYYDFTYRLGYKKAPQTGYVNTLKSKIFEAWQSGEPQIEESMAFAVAPDIEAKHKFLDNWIKILLEHNTFPKVGSCEKYQRLTLLMRENIKTYGLDPRAAKQKWYEANRIADLGEVSTQILGSYRRFATSLFPDVLSYAAQQALDRQILNELLSRTTLPHREQEALRLESLLITA